MTVRIASKYLKKKKVPKTDGGGTTIVYEYSKQHVRKRHKEKAKRYEGLSKNIDKLRALVSKDLRSDDPKTRLTALAVGLIDAVFERVGNDGSADDGHFGVTGWLKKHVTFGKGKATIKYVGKSGVDHEKVVDDKKLVKALKDCCGDKKPGDTLLSFGKDDAEGAVRVTSRDVNAYLEPFDVTAKDLRGFHANREMQDALRAERKKGGKLPEDKKEREKKLKEEFKAALEATAEAVGHEASTLRTQYLVPSMEDTYMKDGTVLDKLKGASAARVASAWMTRMAATKYVPLLIPADHPRGQKIPMPQKPDDVWIWGRGVPTPQSRPVPHSTAVRADIGHDWHWSGGMFRYSGVGDPGDVWLLLQYGKGGDEVTCPTCGASAPDSARFCPGCGRPTAEWARTATKSESEKEDEEVRRLSRPPPKLKPPRDDSKRERIDTSPDEEKDKDLSLNYKDVGG